MHKHPCFSSTWSQDGTWSATSCNEAGLVEFDCPSDFLGIEYGVAAGQSQSLCQLSDGVHVNAEASCNIRDTGSCPVVIS
jgi:hypothetical protein